MTITERFLTLATGT